jgi:hypothetical protein
MYNIKIYFLFSLKLFLKKKKIIKIQYLYFISISSVEIQKIQENNWTIMFSSMF